MSDDEDGLEWALQTRDEIKAAGYPNMGVTFSRGGEYTKSDDVLLPIPATTPPPDPEPMPDTAPWLADARADIGKYHDGDDVPRLAQEVAKAFPDQADYADEAGPSTAWCGIFVAAKLAKYGIRPPYKAPGNNVESWMYVDSWKGWGTSVPIGQEQPGDVAVFLGSPHHVTFVAGDGEYIGGNQSDGVSEASYRTPDAIRRPPAPSVQPAPAPVGKRNMRIIATVFDDAMGAYGPINHSKPIVSLPAPFPKPLPKIRVFGPKGSAVGDLGDKGPWYDGTAARPADRYWETGKRPRAESDPVTNGAGIDLNPVLADLVGIDGKGQVDWEFVTDQVVEPPPPPPPPPPTGDFEARLKVLEAASNAQARRLDQVVADIVAMKDHAMPDTNQPQPQFDWTPIIREVRDAFMPMLKQILPMLLAAAVPFVKDLIMRWITDRLSAVVAPRLAPPATALATGFTLPQGTVTGALGLIGAIVSALAPMLSQGLVPPEAAAAGATIGLGVAGAGGVQAVKNALTKPKEGA